jgi:glycosyltransferase involved in cell wall biosynthesis
VLFVVSANAPNGASADPTGPRKDYDVIARRLGADVLDWTETQRTRPFRLLARVIGLARTQALLAFTRRHQYDVIVTDGEHIGIPLASLLKVAGANVPHITIGHRLTASKKRPFFRWLKVQSHISAVVLHSRYQYELAGSSLGFTQEQLALVPYQVDPDFWQPTSLPEGSGPEERLIVSAGLEFRDYPTLFRAVDGLDAKLIVAAASNWSKRRNTALSAPRPANVEVSSFDYHGLRALLARAAVVAVPVDDVDFQAGITTVLEAMAMGKPVVVTHSYGQTDVIEDRRSVTRGATDRPRPISLLRNVAEEEDVPIEPNGFYVPPHDPDALRRALMFLLDHPEHRAQLGAAGRQAVEQLMTVDQFADRIAKIVEIVVERHAAESSTPAGSAPGQAAPAAGAPRAHTPESTTQTPRQSVS